MSGGGAECAGMGVQVRVRVRAGLASPIGATARAHVASGDGAGRSMQIDSVLGKELNRATRERGCDDTVHRGEGHTEAIPFVCDERDSWGRHAVDEDSADLSAAGGSVGPDGVVALGSTASRILAVGLVLLRNGRELWHIHVRQEQVNLLHTGDVARQDALSVLNNQKASSTATSVDGGRAVVMGMVPELQWEGEVRAW